MKKLACVVAGTVALVVTFLVAGVKVGWFEEASAVRWMTIALDWFKVGAWPGLALAVLVTFRREIGALLARARLIRGFGAEFHMAELISDRVDTLMEEGVEPGSREDIADAGTPSPQASAGPFLDPWTFTTAFNRAWGLAELDPVEAYRMAYDLVERTISRARFYKGSPRLIDVRDQVPLANIIRGLAPTIEEGDRMVEMAYNLAEASRLEQMTPHQARNFIQASNSFIRTVNTWVDAKQAQLDGP